MLCTAVVSRPLTLAFPQCRGGARRVFNEQARHCAQPSANHRFFFTFFSCLISLFRRHLSLRGEIMSRHGRSPVDNRPSHSYHAGTEHGAGLPTRGGHCLHQARRAVRASASRTKGEPDPVKALKSKTTRRHTG